MKLNRLLFYMLLAVALSGCVPNAVSYYSPEIEGGTVISAGCVSTESLVDFDIKDAPSKVKVRVWARDGQDVNLVYLGFSGNLWDSVHFSSTDFMIVDLDKNVTIRPLSIYASKHDSYAPFLTEPYFPPQKPRAAKSENLPRFSVDIKFNQPLPERFELISPSIYINGKELTFPSVRFEKRLWMGISPFNC